MALVELQSTSLQLAQTSVFISVSSPHCPGPDAVIEFGETQAIKPMHPRPELRARFVNSA